MGKLIDLIKSEWYDTDKYSWWQETVDKKLIELIKQGVFVDGGHFFVDCYYDARFEKIKDNQLNMLEIGIYRGDSIRLWNNYFQNANIDCIDVYSCDKLNIYPRVNQIVSDAYTFSTLNTIKDEYYDIIIEDGPHNMETVSFVLQHYCSKLKPNGLLVIEDVKETYDFDALMNCIPEKYKKYANIFNYTNLSGRYDDILLVIDLENSV